ncbi:MAG: hypothetical protein ACLQFW_03260 [Xanthobacteraceae bacterium]
MKHAIMAGICAAFAAVCGAGDAFAGVWRWGCMGPLGAKQIIFTRFNLIVVPAKPSRGTPRELAFSGDLAKGSERLTAKPIAAGATTNHRARIRCNAWSKRSRPAAGLLASTGGKKTIQTAKICALRLDYLASALERDRFRLNRLRSNFLVEHDLFGKPASTFPDHALEASA